MELGYWNIKGIVEPIRWLIEYLDIHVKIVTPSRDEWYNSKKYDMGLNFPNLPYFIDGDVKITESSAIPYYLAHKFNKPELFGKDYKEEALVRQYQGLILDLYQILRESLNAPNAAEEFQKVTSKGSKFQTKIEELSKSLGEKEYFLGHLTWADFVFAYIGEFYFILSETFGTDKDILEKPANLKALVGRVHHLPGVKERVAEAINLPIYPDGRFSFKILTTAQAKAKYDKRVEVQA